MFQPNHRRAFTLVELMVVVVIIGMLMTLLLTAVQSARETARRTQCLDKLRNIGSALHQFETANQQFPGWRHYPFHAVEAEGIPPKPFKYSTGWFPQLFPYLGYEWLFDRTKPLSWKRPARRGEFTFGYAPVLHNVAVCPSDVDKMRKRRAQMSYSANCGREDAQPSKLTDPAPHWPADWRANGFFHNYLDWRGNPNVRVVTVNMDSSYIKGGDGLSSTLMVSENLDARQYFDRDERMAGFVWDWPMAGDFQAINGPGFDGALLYARPSSNHRGGVNAVFGDGHARFLNEKMDYLVYVALMTTKGSEAREPGSTTPSDDKIRKQPKLTDDQF